MRKHPGNKSTNPSGANSTFLPGKLQKELDIPVIVDAYNQHKVGVDVADQYRIYFDTQLISRRNWYPHLYWIQQTARINSLEMYRHLPAKTERTVDHMYFHLLIVCDLLQAGSPSSMKTSSRIPPSQQITRSASTTQSPLPRLPNRLVTNHTPLPIHRKVPGMHSLLWMENRVECFLCRWRRSQGGSGEGIRSSIKCDDCNEVLCFPPKQNCFHEFHHM